MSAEYGYEFDGLGLLVYCPNGTVYLQGDEAIVLYDLLESLETDREVAMVLDPYSEVCR